MVEDVERLEQFLAHNIPETISSIAIPFFVTIYMFFLDWRMALALLCTIPLAYVFFIVMMKGYKEKMNKYTKATEKMNGTIVEYIKGMEVIKAFNQTTKSFSKYSESLKNYKVYTMEWFKYCWPYMSAYLVVLSANSIVIIPVGVYFYFKGTLDLAVYILFMLISLEFAAPILKFTEFLDGIILICSAEQSINDVLNEEELYKGKETVVPDSYDIKFKDVKFSYDKKDVLNGITLDAKQGETTALVGPSGSGKSTIAKLIARFWDVGSGVITIGNIDIKDIPIKKLMETISFVFQDVFLFNDTIMENIRMGKKDASDEEVIEAAKRAMCHDFILKTENGYNTIVGSDGSKLSGGERQRISIARAILRNAPIVILDEATAYTDPENEDKIQQSINSLAKDKTLIVIAHRLSTIVDSDKIIVINEGNIESQGTHSELLEKSSHYINMWKAHIDAMNWQFDLRGGGN
jgi:ATP-binding cassette subfamily B protein